MSAMSHRFIRMAATLILAGCSADAPQPQASAGAETIECALGQKSTFAPVCMVERVLTDGMRILIVRHPDGGFRRFQQVDDGRGLIVADGSDGARVSMDDDMMEIAVGPDRYRFRVKTAQTAHGV